jgi:hypothetical protein
VVGEEGVVGVDGEEWWGLARMCFECGIISGECGEILFLFWNSLVEIAETVETVTETAPKAAIKISSESSTESSVLVAMTVPTSSSVSSVTSVMLVDAFLFRNLLRNLVVGTI